MFEKVKKVMGSFLESSTPNLSYIKYVDNGGNELEQEEIIFTAPTIFDNRKVQSEGEETERKYTVSTPGVEYIFDEVGNFPIALKTRDGEVLYQKISAKTGEILPVHAGCCKSLDIIYAGAPSAGKTVHTVQMSDPLFHDALARDTGCSFEDDWPLGSDEKKFYENARKDLRQHKLPGATKRDQSIPPAIFHVTYMEKLQEQKHILVRLQDMAGESWLNCPKKNQYGYIFFMIGADELIEGEMEESPKYKEVFDNLMFGEKNLSKKRNYELMLIITKADLLDREDPNLETAFEKNSVFVDNGKLYQDIHGEGFDYQAFDNRGRCVQTFLKEQCPNFSNRLINNGLQKHIKFSMIASIGESSEMGGEFQEYKPFCIDEPVLSVLADQGMYPVAVSGEKIEVEMVQGKGTGLSEIFKQSISKLQLEEIEKDMDQYEEE